jgi:hypothetical protein
MDIMPTDKASFASVPEPKPKPKPLEMMLSRRQARAKAKVTGSKGEQDRSCILQETVVDADNVQRVRYLHATKGWKTRRLGKIYDIPFQRGLNV